MTQISEKISLTLSLDDKTQQAALAMALGFIPDFEINADAAGFAIEDHADFISIQNKAADLKAEIKKPFRFGVVVDEIYRLQEQQQQSLRDQKIWLGHDLFDPRDMVLQRSEKTIELTEKEVSVLQLLIQNAPDAVTRDELLQSVWGYHPDVTTHTVETHLWRLRQKIEIDPAAPAIVVTTADGYTLGVSIKVDL